MSPPSPLGFTPMELRCGMGKDIFAAFQPYKLMNHLDFKIVYMVWYKYNIIVMQHEKTAVNIRL